MPERIDGTVRQRAERRDVGHARRALEVVAPVRDKVGDWQARALRLRMLAERDRRSGKPVDELLDAARGLLVEIEQARQYLDEQASSLPLEVAGHSRYQDVVRAVTTAWSAAGSVLDAGSPEDRTPASSRG